MTVITEATIKDLAGFKSADTPVVSCYLDVDGRRQIRPKDYQLELASLKKQLLASHPGQNFDADFALMSDYVAQQLDRHGVRGLAMFSCADKKYWKVIRLPVSVANRLSVNQSPVVAPLEAIVHALEPLGVLLVDRQRARMFNFSKPFRVSMTDEMMRVGAHENVSSTTSMNSHINTSVTQPKRCFACFRSGVLAV